MRILAIQLAMLVLWILGAYLNLFFWSCCSFLATPLHVEAFWSWRNGRMPMTRTVERRCYYIGGKKE